MAANYVLLSRITVSAYGASSVTFLNIPQTGYTDLKIVASVRGAVAGVFEPITVLPNGSGSNGTRIALYGSGSTAGSENASNIRFDYFTGNSATANTFGSGEIYIPNYTSSSFKSFSMEAVGEDASTTTAMAMTAGLWSTTAAITSLQLTALNGNILADSEFSLYGISAVGATPAIAPLATGGDVVANDGTYWYHAFLSSGAFVPGGKSLTCDLLVVAGGGSSGPYVGGGGGAGGLLQLTSQTVSSPTNVIVGAGGGQWNYPAKGLNGSNSQFGSLTAAVGGGYGTSGGGHDAASGIGNGGSGGGGGSGGQTTGGTGTAGQGNAGGNSAGATGNYGSGGGGGAGAAGGNGGSVGGTGGIGLTSTMINAMGAATGQGQFSSSNYYFAGGGGGAVGNTSTVGAGGLGGGGVGAQINGVGGLVVAGASGTANTGGGGGGGNAGTNNSLLSNQGGSGIIIVRYPMA